MASSGTALDQGTLRMRAENLFAGEPVAFLGFLPQFFSGEAQAVLTNPGSEARQILEFAQQEYPDSTVLTISRILESSVINLTRHRCARLLRHLFKPGQNLYSRLSAAAQNQFKMILLRRIHEEKFSPAHDILFRVFSHLTQLLLPKKQWPEAIDYLFESLKSDDAKKIERALNLFEKVIPRRPELFLIHVGVLSEAFKVFMGGARQNLTVSAAAAGASVQLILHLATPSSHEKYYDLLHYMLWVLSVAFKASNDGLLQKSLTNMETLAGQETRFLRPPIDVFVDSMLVIAEDFALVSDEVRELAVEVITVVAEDKEYGCGMIQNLSPVLLKRLFAVLLGMMAIIDDDGENEEISSNCTCAIECLKMLVVALRENVVMRSLPDCLVPDFLEDAEWGGRFAAITFLGLLADGCLWASLGVSGTLVTFMLTLWNDPHPRVCKATIEAVGQFSENWGPHLHDEIHAIFLPALLDVMEDFGNPLLQTAAASTMVLFIKNSSSDVFRPHMERIFNNYYIFKLQEGDYCAMKQAALTSLASLAESFQEEFDENYNYLLSRLNDELAILPDQSHLLVTARTIDCMTKIGLAVGKEKFMNNVDQIVEVIIHLQECCSASDHSVRCCLLKAWGRLCKCLGTEFVPYLDISLPVLFRSAQLSIDQNSNRGDERSHILDEKATACDMLCCIAEELTAEIHLWINEILGTFLPLLTFKSDVRVRTTAISGMPLMLHSASLAMQKGLSLDRSVEESGEVIILALIDAFREEFKISFRMKILEATNKCIQISGSCLGKSIVNQIIKHIAEVLLVCSHTKTERKRRVQKGLDRREKELLKEEIEVDNNVYKTVADCLGSILKVCKATILPIFDKLLLPRLALMDVKNSTTERTILLRIFRDVAEHCGEDAFKHYEQQLLSMLKDCDIQNPDVWEIIAHGISICAEFGGSVFKPHLEVAISKLEGILKNPKGRHPNHVVAYEIAVVAFGKICKFHCGGPNAYKVVDIWLDCLPLENNLAEAKLVHDDLCTMIEKFEDKVLGPRPRYNDFRRIIKIFSKVMWAGNNLATDDTLNRMKKILNRLKRRILPSDFESICSSFPHPIETMLKSSLTDSCAKEVVSWRNF